jgi:EmrB/QacA subfamily drug resistance transporter
MTDSSTVITPPKAPSAAATAVKAPRTAQAEHWGLPLVVVIIGMFMSLLDTSIINVAAPVIQKQFSVSADQVQWITTSYSLCEGIVVPASAWLGARFGLRRIYLFSLIAFSMVSAMCGMSGNLGIMILFRILQGIPGGIIPATSLTMLYRLVPPQKLGAAMGLYGLGVIVAPGIGPTLGGYLVEYADWRLIFYINVPIGIIGTIASILILPHMPGNASEKFDIPGFACIALGLFAMLLALSEGQEWGWRSYPILMLIAAGTNLLALFVIIELNSDHPMLDVRVFRSWPFVNSLILTLMASVGLFAVLFYIPNYLQNAQGITPWHTGLVLIPQAVAMAILMPITGRLYDRFGGRWPATVGLMLTCVGMLLLSRINIDMNRFDLAIRLVTLTSGLGIGMMPIMTAGIAALPPEAVNSGSAFNTLVQRVSSALGLAVLTSLSTAQQAQFTADRAALLIGVGPNVDPRIAAMEAQGPAGLIPVWRQLQADVQAQAYSNVFLISGGCALAGVLFALMLPSGGPRHHENQPAPPAH